jgi:hypothetical protein
MRLTKRQKRIVNEIERIRGAAYNYDNVAVSLEAEKEGLVRIRILLDCLLIEEAMSLIIMDYVLQDSPKWKATTYFGRTKRYHLFYDDILGHIPPFQKLNILKDVIKIPKKLENILRKIFNLRNVFSHVFTVDYTNLRKMQYNGKTLFDIDAFEKFVNDADQVVIFLLKRLKF